MLSIGIVGLPNVGKSTLFKAITKKQIDIQNYPFTTIDPNVGVVAVPDPRLEKLTKMSNSAKTIPTAVEFIDIAGLVKGASEGEGLGNKFLANIREVDAIAEVVRVFDIEGITHVHNRVDPVSDIEIINTELIMADLDTVTRRLEKIRGNDPDFKLANPLLQRLQQHLQQAKLANSFEFDEKEAPIMQGLHLLTAKKFIYIFNVSEDQLKNKWQPSTELLKAIGDSKFVILSNTFELLLSESSPEEQEMYLGEVGLSQSGLDELIKVAYSTLNLITFLTTGEDETRAWTAKKDSLIPKAVAAIHSDFEQKFIRADLIQADELLEIGSWSGARQIGKLRTVGKDYIIQDGDVVEVKLGN